MAETIHNQLKELGLKLESPPTSKDALIKLLKQAASCLSELAQSPSSSILESMKPCINAIVKQELLRHQDRDVKLLVAACITEITRITAPEAPYNDDVLRAIFHLIVDIFGGLGDISGPSLGRRVVILETLARYRSCVVMLDLECDDLVNRMFKTFLSVVSDNHSENVVKSMQTIMILLLEESEDVVQENLFIILLSTLGRGKSGVSLAARKLAMNVIEQCALKLEHCLNQLLISSISGDDIRLDYHEVIYDIYRCDPEILSGMIPYLTGELLTDQLETRLKAVKLLGDLFSLSDCVISEAFQPVFSEFLKRLTDRVVEVRMSVIEHSKSCVLANPSRKETPQIIDALCDRLLDFDENVRKQVVAAICDVSCHALGSISDETTKLIAERLRDKSLLVRSYTMERLAEIFRLHCLKCSDASTSSSESNWIPGKILKCFYDKDIRPETIEVVMFRSLLPTEFSTREIVKHWIAIFSGFDKVEVKALEKIMEQKQRLQQEMQKYMTLRKAYQDTDAPEFQKKVLHSFRVMSRWFADPVKAEECFKILDQLKDANIWKMLTNLLDPDTSFQQAWTIRVDLLQILGEKHKLYDFLGTLSVKYSYLLFNKEFLKEIILEAATLLSAGNKQLLLSSMNILVMLAQFSPLLLSGSEDNLVILLKEDNDIVIEGIVHVLAKAGGSIREQLAAASSSVDLILERLCLEGSRKQAKYAVHALAVITKDDGLKSLSVLYKRLVDMLEDKTHLPAILQSLGCIAQTAMPVFETRETEILEFITSKILKCSNQTEDTKKLYLEDRSELCSLKIFGIKALVKSYLPIKDSHLRLGFANLLEILKNVLAFGEISKDMESSSVDRAHMRLASAKAVLRLSKDWDHKIPIDVFHLTLRTSEIIDSQVKKLFLGKVRQYIKDRLLDPKYACAILLSINGSELPEFKEDKHSLFEIIQMCHQARARQHSMQCEGNPLMMYPEYILPYLVHTLAHHPSCPNVDTCSEVKAFEPIYRKLHIFTSLIMHGDEDGKSEISTNKESVSTLVSIFQSIKRSEDMVDVMKSKNSHAISDLGLSITNRLALKEDDLTTFVPLPSELYKPQEKSDVVNEGNTWLASESVTTHLESLDLEPKAKDNLEAANIDEDGNEMPLGMIIKRLKLQGTKSKKVAKKKVSSTMEKDQENEIDILGMVREINLDNPDEENKTGNDGGEANKDQSNNVKARVSQKRKWGKVEFSTSVKVPKRRRSSSTSKGPRKFSIENSHVETPSFKSIKTDEKHDIINRSFSPECENKETNEGLNVTTHVIGESADHELKTSMVEANETNVLSGSNSLMGSSKKRKRRSIAGLAKCSSEVSENHGLDLIGCRIKVWWPLDKMFYEGVVQSYNSGKKKHEIMYDDGDVEVLQLDKELWEITTNDGQPRKRLQSPKISPSKGLSLQQKKKSRTPSGSKRKNRPTKKSSSGKKRTPKIKEERDEREILESGSEAEYSLDKKREASDLSNAEPTTTSKVDDNNSGDSEEKSAGETQKSLDRYQIPAALFLISTKTSFDDRMTKRLLNASFK
ncbi:hypothetical protein GIB67_013455 [Kingdonia uniflora]|uniref:Uncharacterized protein n=1 Tax=Kingdonia uniflora TaxID=39325 RepID=A0A7J7LRG2_9MAGN|nr:hypothetical protein GIB67_013455 [Kingdonia uniflora]